MRLHNYLFDVILLGPSVYKRSKYDKEHTYGVYNCEQYKWYTIIEFEHDIESNDIVSRNLPFTWKYLGYTFRAKCTRDTKD